MQASAFIALLRAQRTICVTSDASLEANRADDRLRVAGNLMEERLLRSLQLSNIDWNIAGVLVRIASLESALQRRFPGLTQQAPDA